MPYTETIDDYVYQYIRDGCDPPLPTWVMDGASMKEWTAEIYFVSIDDDDWTTEEGEVFLP